MKKILLAIIISILYATPTFAQYLLFTNENCPHCLRLETKLQDADFYEKVGIETYEISKNEQNLALYMEKSKEVGYESGGVPLLIDGEKFVEGADPIYDYLIAKHPLEPVVGSILNEEDSEALNEMIKSSLRNPPARSTEPPQAAQENETPKIILIAGGAILLITAIYKLYLKFFS